MLDDTVDIASLTTANRNLDREYSFLRSMGAPKHPSVDYDVEEFLLDLSYSISLTFIEKRRILQNVDTLSEFQITQLQRIFKQEKKRMDELERKYDLKKQKIMRFGARTSELAN